MRARSAVLMVMLLVTVTGCDKVAQAMASHKYKDLQRFIGKAPAELLADPQIGPAINQLVPAGLNSCMDDVFNYAEDITQLADGTIRSSASGSRADSERVGYVSVEPSGRIDVILWCDHNRDYCFWYSTATIEKNASRDLIVWAQLVGGNGPTLRRFGESHTRNFSYESIQKGELASEFTADDKKAWEQKQAAKARGPYIRSGAVICINAKSFYKVNAIEMTGNNYVGLPAGCEYAGSDIAVNVLRQFSDPVVGSIAVLGNAGGSVLVRTKDLNGE